MARGKPRSHEEMEEMKKRRHRKETLLPNL